MSLVRYSGTNIAKALQSQDLIVVESVKVAVRDLDGNIVSLYKNSAGTTPKTNPFTTDNTGQFFFYVEQGEYIVDTEKGGQAGSIQIDLTQPSNTESILTLDELINDESILIGDIKIISDRGFAKLQAVDSLLLTPNDIDLIASEVLVDVAFKVLNTEMLSAESFGMVANDVLQGELNYNAIKQIFLNDEYNNLYIDTDKTYTVSSQVSNEVIAQVNRPFKFHGKGHIAFTAFSDGDYIEAIKVNSSNVCIRDCELSADSSTSNSVLISVLNGSNCEIMNAYLHGTSENRPVHTIKVEDAAQCENWKIHGNKFEYTRFGLFSANAFGTNNNGGYARNWSINGNTFLNFLNDAVEFNSDNTAAIPAGRPWSMITVSDNIFDTKLSTQSNIVIGGDSVSSISITGNVIENVNNPSNACIHIENAAGSVAITGNTLRNVAAGIEVYPSGFSNESDYGNITISGNSVDGSNGYTYTQSVLFIQPQSGNRFGISLILNPTGSSYSASVIGNTVRNFNTGIFAGSQQRDTIVHSNQISLCYEGIGVSSRLSQNVKDNNVEHCPNVFGVSGNNISLGSVNCKNCYRLFSNQLIETTRITNIRWSVYGNTLARPSFPPQVLTPVRIFELPTFFNGNFAIEIFGAGWTAYTDQVGWDGVELTDNNTLNEYGLASIAVSGTPMSTSAQDIKFNVFNGGTTSINNVDWTVEFTGYAFWI